MSADMQKFWFAVLMTIVGAGLIILGHENWGATVLVGAATGYGGYTLGQRAAAKEEK